MTKSGATVRVGTTVPGAQAHTPTVDIAVGGDSSNTANTGPTRPRRLWKCQQAEAATGREREGGE